MIQTATVMSDYVVIRGVSRCADVPRGNYPRRMAFSLLNAVGWVIAYFMGSLWKTSDGKCFV